MCLIELQAIAKTDQEGSNLNCGEHVQLPLFNSTNLKVLLRVLGIDNDKWREYTPPIKIEYRTRRV